MARGARYGVDIEDVGGSFKRFIRQAPIEARSQMHWAIKKNTLGAWQAMRANAPVGPEAPHIKDALEWKANPPRSGGTKGGLVGRAGILSHAHDPSRPGAKGEGSDQAHIALYNEFAPNRQPFMRMAARGQETSYKRDAIEALKRVERNLSGGGGFIPGTGI